MMIHRLSTGDGVHRYNKSIVVQFEGARKVLSTSPINGGYRENLKSVFNHDNNPGAGMACKLKAPTYEEHMRIIAGELGLDPDFTAGISTAASMDNVSIKAETFENLTVTALVTGGVEVNGGRVGDPASYHERQEKVEMVKHGTINIILVIDADLPEGTLARALVTCTEAKTAALQELMAGSNYSHGLATGSGTDGIIVICNAESKIRLTNAGKHSKLGELIGRAVKSAVKEALFLQTGLCPEYQHSILRRFKRYGINEDRIWDEYNKFKPEKSLTKAEFIHNIHTVDRRGDLVALTSLYIHLLDQLDWELLSVDDVVQEGKMIAGKIAEKLKVEYQWQDISSRSPQKVIEEMVENFAVLMAAAAGGVQDV